MSDQAARLRKIATGYPPEYDPTSRSALLAGADALDEVERLRADVARLTAERDELRMWARRALAAEHHAAIATILGAGEEIARLTAERDEARAALTEIDRDLRRADLRVVELTRRLAILAECHCATDWTDRGLHAPECLADEGLLDEEPWPAGAGTVDAPSAATVASKERAAHCVGCVCGAQPRHRDVDPDGGLWRCCGGTDCCDAGKPRWTTVPLDAATSEVAP